MVDGTDLRVALVRWEHEQYGTPARDVAVLRVMSDDRALPSLPIGNARSGEIAVLLGYPANIGVNGDGHLAYDMDASDLALRPLATVVRVIDPEGVTLRPVVGCVPLPGMSGAAVLTASGVVAGVFVRVSTTTVGNGVEQVLEAAPVTAGELDPADRGG